MLTILAALALTAPGAERWSPAAGTRGYRYEAVDHVPSQPDRGYRADYALITAADGSMTVAITAASRLEGQDWTPAAVDDACRAAMHAGPGELARVRIFPVAPDVAETLDQRFLDSCAPREIFTPLADLLLTAQVQASPDFALAELAAPGDSARFKGFRTRVDRFGTALVSTSPGGTIRFAALDGSRASIDWTSDPMTLVAHIRDAIPGKEIVLEGAQQLAVRFEIDRVSGALLALRFVTARVDGVLSVPDAPPIPMSITRETRIELRP